MNIVVLDKTFVDQIVAIEQKAQIEPWSLSVVNDLFEHSYYTILGAVNAQGFLAGYLVFNMIFEVSELQNIAVAPEYQGKKIGSELMKTYIDILLEQKSERSLLEVRISNTVAISLYNKYNYKQIAIRKNYYKTADNGRENAIIMELSLI